MSGVEAIAVLGLIAAIVSIIDGIKQVYDTATDAQGLPEAFHEVAGRLPIVGNILASAKQHIDQGDLDEDSCKGVRSVVETCEKKAKKLNELFSKAIPADGASSLKRYYKAVKASGKGNEVESLMKEMLEDVQLLASEHGMKIATKAEQEEIVKAIATVSAVEPSIPEDLFQETGITANNSGSGTQNNAWGENIAQGSSRQYNTGGGAMHFAQSNFYTTTQNVSVLPPMEDLAQDCLRALFLTNPIDDREKLISTKGLRADGTCEWIRSNELYENWLKSHSQLLWLSGGPGKGKTMLSIFLAEELEQIARYSRGTVFLQYFCDNKDNKRNTAVAVLRGLIFQLLNSQSELFDNILPSFKIQKESLFTDSSFHTLWKIFESMVYNPILNITYCIVDGLDECDEASLEVLLTKFAALFSTNTNESSVSHLHLIIVSRDLPEFIPYILSTFPHIRLDADADAEVNNDIDRFIEKKVDELSIYRGYPSQLCIRVKQVFKDRAQGTFLWVGIVAKVLKNSTLTEVERVLDLFPSGLDELYARMLLNIDSSRRETAARILRWVVMAVRPLTISELSIAIETTINPSKIAFNRDDVTRDQISGCGHFLTIRKNEVGLIHQSAKDYLLRMSHDSDPDLEFFRIKEEEANLEIARKCFNYIQNSALESGSQHIRDHGAQIKTFPLLSYATLYWPQHAGSLARSEDIFDLSLPFYRKNSQLRICWLETYKSLAGLQSGLNKDFDASPESFTLLHVASFFGILPLAENFLSQKGLKNKLKQRFDLNREDSRGGTALSYACDFKHEAIARLLLEKGADTDRGYPLSKAAFHGHEAVLHLLLEKGANVKNRKGALALKDAAEGGQEAIVRFLLEKGANLEANNLWGTLVLIEAAAEGNETAVRLYLEKGADINGREHGETALLIATANGREAMVRLLLEKGADTEDRVYFGSFALARAIEEGHRAIGRSLLEKGDNIRGKKWGYTALIIATIRRERAILQLLLEYGADAKAKDNDGWTALDWAECAKDKAMVEMLTPHN